MRLNSGRTGRLACPFLFLAILTPAPAQQLLSWESVQNRVNLQFTTGPVQIELASYATFKVRRGQPADANTRPLSRVRVQRKETDSATAVRLETDQLTIEISRATGLISVSTETGLRLYTEAAATIANGEAVLELETPFSERFYGFGPRPDPNMDARGTAFETRTLFFGSGKSYWVWFDQAGRATVDVAKTNPTRLRISIPKADHLEYLFTVSDSFKEMLDRRMRHVGSPDPPSTEELGLITSQRIPESAVAVAIPDRHGESRLCGEAFALVHASLSAIHFPAFDLAPYRGDPVILKRAANLGQFAPVLFDSSLQPADGLRREILDKAKAERARLSHFLLTYADEARTRGYTVLHPLLMQFPRDPVAGRQIDSFFFGDELLIIPSCDNQPREVYLPMGTWTDLDTEERHQGRRKVTLKPTREGVIVLAKNGSLFPFANPGGPTELHYIPSNGGEFFLWEPDRAEYSQAHASPAAGIWRFEMESKVDRAYTWVIHHLDKPKTVGIAGSETPFTEVTATTLPRPNTWRYDPQSKRLYIGIEAKAGIDLIVNAHP